MMNNNSIGMRESVNEDFKRVFINTNLVDMSHAELEPLLRMMKGTL